jgi:nitrogen fixation NifU-like protein
MEAEVVNSLCGDQLRVMLAVEQNQVQAMKWQGEGCAISLAAADLLAEKITHMNLDQVRKLVKQDIFELLGTNLKPSREKCALLGLECVQQILNQPR